MSSFTKPFIAYFLLFIATSFLSLFLITKVLGSTFSSILRENPESELSFWFSMTPYFVYFICFFTITIVAYFMIPSKTYVHFVAGGSLAGLIGGASSIKIASFVPAIHKFNNEYGVDVATAIIFACFGVLVGTLINYFIFFKMKRKSDKN